VVDWEELGLRVVLEGNEVARGPLGLVVFVFLLPKVVPLMVEEVARAATKELGVNIDDPWVEIDPLVAIDEDDCDSGVASE